MTRRPTRDQGTHGVTSGASMFVREAVVVFFTIALTVIVFALISYGVARRIIREQVSQRLQSATSDRARMIELYVAQQLERVSLVSSRTQLRHLCSRRDHGDISPEEFRTKSRQILVDAMKSSRDFLDISVANTQGEVITSTRTRLLGRDFADSREFQQARKAAHLGEPVASQNGLTALLTAPAYSQEGRWIGVVIITLNAEPLAQILSDTATLSETARIHVGRNDGGDVHFLLPVPDQSPKLAVDLVPPLELAIQGASGFRSTTYEGRPVLAAYRPVAYQPEFQDWGMVALIEEEAAYAPVGLLRRMLLPVGLLALVTAVGAGWWIAFRYARPIMRLAESASAIACGNFEARVPVNSSDEVGALSRAFNEMAAHVQASHETLERRVEERTRELERANLELARSNRDLQQFAAIASHDLQEPLRAVAGFTELLREKYGGQLDVEAREYMDFTIAGAGRMKTLIDSLLKYARVQTHGKSFQQFACVDALHAALHNLHEAIEENHAQITWDELGEVRADRDQLTQLFQNLISNAIKFRAADPPQIHISVVRRDSDLLFSVRDNGIGMEAKHQKRVFDIFQRLHTESEYPGMGLGLAICERIVDRHAGEIWVNSTPGQGSTFHFRLSQQVSEPLSV